MGHDSNFQIGFVQDLFDSSPSLLCQHVPISICMTVNRLESYYQEFRTLRSTGLYVLEATKDLFQKFDVIKST